MLFFSSENHEVENQQSFTIAEVQEFITAQQPENTLNKTQYDLNIWKQYRW